MSSQPWDPRPDPDRPSAAHLNTAAAAAAAADVAAEVGPDGQPLARAGQVLVGVQPGLEHGVPLPVQRHQPADVVRKLDILQTDRRVRLSGDG